MKPKVLAWCDFLVPTGFGQVAKNLLDDMHHEYDVHVVGINYRGSKSYDTSKYFVYATALSNNDFLGTDILIDKAKELKPDLIFLFQDMFYISRVIERLKNVSPGSKIVIYFPVDGGPLSYSWYDALIYADSILVYTDWAKDMINDVFNINKPLIKLYHGVDTDVFYPLEDEKIIKLRKDQGWEGKFAISNVNRFQPRKAITITCRAFAMFSKGFLYCKDCSHHMPLSRKRCELCRSSNLREQKNNLKDVMLYLHMMPQEKTMGPGEANMLQNHLINCGFADADMNKTLSVNGSNIYAGEVPESRVNEIYNISNVNITSTLGEGCGLSLIESAAAGTPSIAPYNSAIPEMLGDTGWMCKNKAIISQANDNGFFRPVVDEWDMVQTLKQAYKLWKKRGSLEVTKKQECIDLVKSQFLWEDKVALLKKVFKFTLSGIPLTKL